MEYELRQYQREAVKAGLDTFARGGRDVLTLPCGSGKSLVIASIAKELSGDTIVFCHSKEILEQNLQKMRDFGFYDVGVFSASMGEKTLGKITLATIGTIYNQKDIWNMFENVIIDEAHSCNAKGGMYEEFITAHGGAVLGLTATPYRLHSYNDLKSGERAVVAKMLNRTRPKIFDNIVHITQIKEMYEQKFLCPLTYLEDKDYNHSALKLNTTGMDFTTASMDSLGKSSGITQKVVEHSAQLISAGKKHILIFQRSVEETKETIDKLNERGITAEIISAGTDKEDRELILQKFKSGEIKVVSNVGTMTTGFDFPELDCVILARPTQSVALYSQMVGRAIRNSEYKKTALIVDLCGNVKRFGKIETFEFVQVSEKSKLLRLKSDVSFLTGFDFVNNVDLEKRDYKGYKEGRGGSDIVFFGKYKGQHISKLPMHYLEWCVKTFNSGTAKDTFSAEINRREKNGKSRNKN